MCLDEGLGIRILAGSKDGDVQHGLLFQFEAKEF